jgi:Sulfotransferase family
MFDYLSVHPDVFTPQRKEPSYFAADLDTGTRGDSRYFTRDRDDYLALFDEGGSAKRVGEGSVWYLYSEVAAAKIKEFAPQARIIVMLRNPVEMAYSLHAQRLVSGAEDIGSFEEALATEGERAEGRRIPRTAFVVKGLLYRQVVRYAAQVRRYFEVFGRDQVLVLFFEDFTADPAAAYRQVCEFLEIDPSHVPSFERVNQNTVVRSSLVRDLVRFHPRVPRWKVLEPLRRRLRAHKRALLKANQKVASRQTLPPALRKRLEAEFIPDVEELGRLVGRDLVDYWKVG